MSCAVVSAVRVMAGVQSSCERTAVRGPVHLAAVLVTQVTRDGVWTESMLKKQAEQ